MRNSIRSKTSKFALAAVAASISLGAMAASATAANAAVTTCNAPGGRQEAGALIGALVGGVVGNRVAANERGIGTAVGAGAGAAIGSAVGCKQQEDRAAKDAAYYRDAYRASNTYLARSTVNIRSQPTTKAARVGSLRGGETFQSLGATRDGNWIMVGRNGYRVGYVSADHVQPAGRRHASYSR